MPKLTVMLTGATGFAGWHVAAQLRARGHRVRALVRDLEKGRRLLSPLGIGDEDLVVGSMTDAEAVGRALEGCNAAVHAAAAVSVTAPGASDDAFNDNVIGTRTVVGGACERGLETIVFVSSLTAILDHDAPRITADSPLVQSATRYGRSKADSDALVRELQAQGKPVAIVYPSAILGPDDPGRSESMSAFRGFLQQMIDTEGGTQFVDARDLALLIERILTSHTHTRIIAAGEYSSWPWLIENIGDVTGAKIGRIKAPGWLLRLAGSAADIASRVTGKKLPMSREAMEVATRWKPIDDSPEVAKLGVRWRDRRETFEDMYRWFLAQGAIKPQAAPRLAE